MRAVQTVVLVLSFAAGGWAQTLGLKPSAIQHVTLAASASAPVVSAGARLSLWADVTPKPGVHVYAPGAQGFMPVSLVMTPRHGVALEKPQYPQPELARTVGVVDLVPLYNRRFRIVQPIAIARSVKAGTTLRLAGAFNYQACDDRICYPAASLPATWSISVR